jgi:hypothetical protein
MSDEQIEEFMAQVAATAPLGRAGTPDEIGKGGCLPRFGRQQLRQRHRTVRRWRPSTNLNGLGCQRFYGNRSNNLIL